jgi:hypothetical protein
LRFIGTDGPRPLDLMLQNVHGGLQSANPGTPEECAQAGCCWAGTADVEVSAHGMRHLRPRPRRWSRNPTGSQVRLFYSASRRDHFSSTNNCSGCTVSPRQLFLNVNVQVRFVPRLPPSQLSRAGPGP